MDRDCCCLDSPYRYLVRTNSVVHTDETCECCWAVVVAMDCDDRGGACGCSRNLWWMENELNVVAAVGLDSMVSNLLPDKRDHKQCTNRLVAVD